ncbi:hypothetical protein WICPIJ_009005 [Wickerhamomyces pijperi]|uniref:Sas10 C-terminal domain-containing protein n=1 Tax=Wickerhamomyces pijperi TaxID=599730 RepID=A0A9P8PTD0_WICPI|nr:hypothetical protein WICPIJ_009005 [Wickerhamomyces pijperi]
MARKSRGPSRNTTHEDYGLDEVDQFHANREKILLEEAQPQQKTFKPRKGAKRYDSDAEDDAVMNIEDGDESSEDEEEEEEEEDEEDVDNEFFGKKDEEGLEENEEEGGWGGRRDYYGADDLSEDEESAKQIEEEALRQQKLHLQELNMDDYVDEEMEAEWTKSAKEHDYGVIQESAKGKKDTTASVLDLQGLQSMDDKSRTKLINAAHPEFVPLSKELSKLNPILEDLKTKKSQNEIALVKFQALSAYISSIASYFALFLAQVREDEPFSMKENSVMEYILSTKEVWRQAAELEDDDEDMEDDVDEEEDQEDGTLLEEGDISDEEAFDSASETAAELEDDVDEEEDQEDGTLLEEGDISDEEAFDSASETVNNASLYSDEEAEGMDSQDSESEDSDLDIDISKPRFITKAKPAQTGDDFTEGKMHEVDASDKQTRKKTLRFYTSKIDQQSRKTGGDEKYTGDNDIPYKERLFERQQRLIEEARKRGLEDKHGVALGEGGDSDDDDESQATKAKQINDGFSKDYYDTVKKSRDDTKANRKEAHNTAKRAAREGKLYEMTEGLDADGKRAVNYQIMKNKGLTPHRRKELRNSRVKKRMKYEKAKKVLNSTKAVYKAPKGAYEGETTGPDQRDEHLMVSGELVQVDRWGGGWDAAIDNSGGLQINSWSVFDQLKFNIWELTL